MFEQMLQFFENVFSKYQCGFRKCFSIQPCLLAMLGKQERSVDNRKISGILLTDLSKAFDCLNHKLLTAELNAYGFSLTSLKLIHNYRWNKNEQTKINSLYSSFWKIIFGVPKGSILGPLLFNIISFHIWFVLDNWGYL